MEDAFQHQWDDLSVCAFPLLAHHWDELSFMLASICFSEAGLFESDTFSQSLLDLATKGLVCRAFVSSLLVEEPLVLPILWNLPVQPYVKKLHMVGDAEPTCLEPIRQLVKAGISKEVAEVVSTDLERSTLYLY